MQDAFTHESCYKQHLFQSPLLWSKRERKPVSKALQNPEFWPGTF